MSSQLEAQTTYQQYTQLYQIAAQMNELAKADPSKTQEAQVASQQVSNNSTDFIVSLIKDS